MIPWGALPHSPRRMHSQLAFTSGGWLMPNDVKKAKSKLQRQSTFAVWPCLPEDWQCRDEETLGKLLTN
jgi:hypothetical protein